MKAKIMAALTRAAATFIAGFFVSKGLDKASASLLANTVADGVVQVAAFGAVAVVSVAWSVTDKLWLSKGVLRLQTLLHYRTTGRIKDLVDDAEGDKSL